MYCVAIRPAQEDEMPYRISRDGGSGSFMCPPGHPNHFYSIKEGTGPNGFHAAFDYAFTPEGRAELPESLVKRAEVIMAEADLTCSEAWVRSVYGYFRNSYSPDGTDRNVSNAFIFRPGCRYTHRYRPCKAGPADPVHTGANVPGWHKWDPATIPPAEHHLGYLCVKSYLPEHTPILDLIESGS